jgi:hypothetical protein
VEVLSGLKPTDRVVENPADSLADGDVVTLADARPVKPPKDQPQ